MVLLLKLALRGLLAVAAGLLVGLITPLAGLRTEATDPTAMVS
jgi:xanthosine utilization system XapX-like protein